MEKNQKNFIVFLVKFFGMYLLWMILYKSIIGEYSLYDEYITFSEGKLVALLLDFFGFDGTYAVPHPPDAIILFWKSKRLIGISDSCNGLILFVLFIVFIVAFPSKWKNRIRFIPIGLLLIYFLNIFRIFCLAVIYIYYPKYLSFNHHYTFTFFVYMDMFLLWGYYVKKFGEINN